MSEQCSIPDYTDLPQEVLEIPKKYKKLVIVGASHNPERPSYQVMEYLLKEGFEVIPVNPVREEILGKKVYPSLSQLPEGFHPEVIIIFRKPEMILPVVEEAIPLKPKVIWMQEGVINEEAKKLAEANGIKVVMNKCFKKVHMIGKK
ncbi:CoA-binding protein [Thermodesulfobacterium sp. TA1]|uniref:CoA-binding protein n=1 Tax=Thermodesulfobacterium sp. TA1 TaxID=2234087 RepID=UPI001232172C|nr:CoA-binding protein [Thermodesulfobacterium sp. TA1]QER41337.1 CoA-binding protein [Thermodesulfobacterium sp. TA1]